MVLLMETKMQKQKNEFLKNKIGYEGMFMVGSVGRRGGLAMLWKEEM
jgi:hypothetical protein